MARHRRAVSSRVCRPTSTMNSGIRGTVTATITAASQSAVSSRTPTSSGTVVASRSVRQVAAQVAVERVHPPRGEGAELPGRRQAGIARSQAQGVVDEVGPQPSGDPGTGADRRGLGGPGQQGASGDHDPQPDEERGEGRERCAVEEGPGHDLREQVGLGDDEAGRDHARRSGEHHEGAGRADVAQQAGVQRLHRRTTGLRGGRPVAAGMSSRVSRRRNTQ